jgi:ATP-binding cassette, subfamily B, bacterial
MFGGFHRGFRETPDRPADPAVRRANLRRIARLFRAYRRRLSAVLVLILVSAALGVVPAFLLRGVLQAIQRDQTTRLSVLAAGMIAIAIVTGVLGVWQTLLSNQVGQRVMHDLRAAVFRHLQRLSLAFFTRTRTGEIQSRISNDIGGVQSVVTSTATSIVSNVTTVLATMIGMAALSWELSIFAFALIPVFVLLTRRVGEQRRAIAKSTQETLADISSLVQESLSVSGILLGKTMGRTDELADRFEGESQTLADLEVRQRMAGRWVMAAIQTSFAIMPVAAYWFAGLALANGSHAISIPTLVSFTTLQTRLFFPVGSLLGVGLDVQTSLALFDRIFDYLDQPVDIEERAGARTLAEAGDVEFDHVWFRYGDGAWTLEDVSFTVPAGTKTALVGETGAGKTTLGYLAARLYDVNEGSVRIADTDVRDLSFASLAELVGVVSQETYLFHATVRENLRFAKPDATDDEIELAADAARIHDLIASLPEGYDTVVGERGYRFSGGEKQRIAIARTILRNPPVLVLDEATSSLDTETERQVQEALDRLAEGRTTIAIAHRLSTVQDADQIVVLDGGQIVERGTHEELLDLGGRYAELVGRAPALGPLN